MASSAYASPQRHSPSLPLNGKIQLGASNHSSPGLPHKDFKNSPAIFGEALASDLDSFHPEECGCWLLQCGDDLLLAAKTKEKCWERTKALLQLLMEAGHRVLKKEAQICKEEVRYLGFVLRKDTRVQTLVGSYTLMAPA